jgi:hypothetical protein
VADGKFISYLRVSTDKQGRSGLGIEAQREAVVRYLNGGQWTLSAEYMETESGRRSDRPKLAAALSRAPATWTSCGRWSPVVLTSCSVTCLQSPQDQWAASFSRRWPPWQSLRQA